MKIAIPTNNDKTISKHTALSKHIAIIEIDNHKIVDKTLRENPIPKMAKDMQSSQREGSKGLGAGRIIPSIVGDADIFIAYDIGEGMRRNLESSGIRVIETDKLDIDSAINDFL